VLDANGTRSKLRARGNRSLDRGRGSHGGEGTTSPPNKEISHRAAVTRLGLWDRELDHGKHAQLALTAVGSTLQVAWFSSGCLIVISI